MVFLSSFHRSTLKQERRTRPQGIWISWFFILQFLKTICIFFYSGFKKIKKKSIGFHSCQTKPSPPICLYFSFPSRQQSFDFWQKATHYQWRTFLLLVQSKAGKWVLQNNGTFCAHKSDFRHHATSWFLLSYEDDYGEWGSKVLKVSAQI